MTPRLVYGGHINQVRNIPGVSAVSWTELETVNDLMVEASLSNGIVVIAGHWGLGKSFAAARAAEACAAHPTTPAAVSWVRLKNARGQGRALFRAIYPQVLGVPYPEGPDANELEAEIEAELVSPHRMLVIDEANLVQDKALLACMGWVDHEDTDFALTIIGTANVWDLLPGEIQDRADEVHFMQGLADDEVVAVLHDYHDVFTSAEDEDLVLANREWALGSFRWWAKFLGRYWRRRNTFGPELTDHVINEIAPTVPRARRPRDVIRDHSR